MLRTRQLAHETRLMEDQQDQQISDQHDTGPGSWPVGNTSAPKTVRHMPKTSQFRSCTPAGQYTDLGLLETVATNCIFATHSAAYALYTTHSALYA